jgi:hypothetical protein
MAKSVLTSSVCFTEQAIALQKNKPEEAMKYAMQPRVPQEVLSAVFLCVIVWECVQ